MTSIAPVVTVSPRDYDAVLADGLHYPGTYLAGSYNRLHTNIAGQVVENEDLVTFPNWLALEFRIPDGDWFNETAVRLLSYGQELDLRRRYSTASHNRIVARANGAVADWWRQSEYALVRCVGALYNGRCSQVARLSGGIGAACW